MTCDCPEAGPCRSPYDCPRTSWWAEPCPNCGKVSCRCPSLEQVPYGTFANERAEQARFPGGDPQPAAWRHSQPYRPADRAPDEPQPDDEPSYLDRLRAARLDTAGLDTLPEPEPLVHGVLQVDSLAWLAGRPGAGKTLIALDLAGSVGTGTNWQGHRVRQGPVLYLIAEGARGIRPRVRAWEAAAGQKMTGVTFLPVAVQAANEGAWSALCDLAAELGAVLVVVDTQARVTVGMEENSARDMGQLVHRLERLRAACGACALVLHHTPRNGDNMRGSTAMEGAATTVIKVVKEGDILTLINDPDEGGKQKDAEPFDPIHLRLVPYGSSVILSVTDTPQSTDIDSRAVRQMVSSWWHSFETDLVSITALVDAGVANKRTFYKYRKALEDNGSLARDGTGRAIRYRLTRDPDEA